MIERIEPPDYTSLEGCINFPSGNRIVYVPEENKDGSIFTYETNNKKIKLNDLLPEGWVIRPTIRRFRALLATGGQVCSPVPVRYPEVHVGVKSLEKDEQEVLYVLHEIGHAWDYDMYAFKTQPLDYPETLYKRQQAFTIFLIHGHREREKEHGYQDFERITERNAWVIALRLKRQLGILPELEGKKLRAFYHKCLESYAAESSRAHK